MLSPLFDCCYFLKRSRQGEFGLIVVGGRDVDEKTLGSQGEGAVGILVPINQRLHTMSVDPLAVWESITAADRTTTMEQHLFPRQSSGATFLYRAVGNMIRRGSKLRWTFMLGHSGNVNQLGWREHLIRNTVRIRGYLKYGIQCPVFVPSPFHNAHLFESLNKLWCVWYCVVLLK